jgi:DNA modification methylase
MSELPDESTHLIVTSPPYCVGMEFEKGISYDEHWENMQGGHEGIRPSACFWRHHGHQRW